MESNKILKALCTPYTALTSVIFGLMIASFPVGAYVVFNSELGQEILYDFPMDGINLFVAGIGFKIPFQFELGDGFILAWCTYLTIFSIAIYGPKTNFSQAVSSLITQGWNAMRYNYVLAMLTWFSILIFSSVVIDNIQGNFGISTEPPEVKNKLIQFFLVTVSPLTEELGFRVFLIGIPLFLIYSSRHSVKDFFKFLWHPSVEFDSQSRVKVISIIVVVGIFFGAAHLLSGTPWSTGKFLQASIGGIIIGWVYFRYGLAPAVLIHWATNYFIFSFIYFMGNLNGTLDQTTNPFVDTLETLLVITGSLAIIIFILNYLQSKKQNQILS